MCTALTRHMCVAQLLLSQLDSVRSSEAQLRAAVSAAEAREKELQSALDAARSSHISDLDAARATFLVTEAVIADLLRTREQLQSDNDRLRQQLGAAQNPGTSAPSSRSTRRSWLVSLVLAAVAGVRPTTRITDGDVSVVLAVRLV